MKAALTIFAGAVAVWLFVQFSAPRARTVTRADSLAAYDAIFGPRLAEKVGTAPKEPTDKSASLAGKVRLGSLNAIDQEMLLRACRTSLHSYQQQLDALGTPNDSTEGVKRYNLLVGLERTKAQLALLSSNEVVTCDVIPADCPPGFSMLVTTTYEKYVDHEAREIIQPYAIFVIDLERFPLISEYENAARQLHTPQK